MFLSRVYFLEQVYEVYIITTEKNYINTLNIS